MLNMAICSYNGKRAVFYANELLLHSPYEKYDVERLYVCFGWHKDKQYGGSAITSVVPYPTKTIH